MALRHGLPTRCQAFAPWQSGWALIGLRGWSARAVCAGGLRADRAVHAAFERRFAGKVALGKVNPLQARRFARSQGKRAKTDRVDARMLAQMGRGWSLSLTRRSGKWPGRAVIPGGRKPRREALYMPALSAARFNPDLKRTYQAMTAAGKPAKVALTALRRNLIERANIPVKNDRNRIPKAA